MTYILIALISLIALGVVAAMTGVFSKSDTPIEVGADCSTCNGDNDKCEMECRMEAAVKEVEYYDDEELDKFIGRSSDSYTDEEAALFGEVLYTMRPEEVKGWSRSLSLRGIEVPDQLKDEMIMLIDG